MTRAATMQSEAMRRSRAMTHADDDAERSDEEKPGSCSMTVHPAQSRSASSKRVSP